MKISGWGRYPDCEANIVSAISYRQLQEVISNSFNGIARGLGRSYGDSALANEIIGCTSLAYLLDFDDAKGNIRCTAGVTLEDILTVFVPRGWFLPVSPGTKFITVGGAIASDVHGKNHHSQGTITNYVNELKLLLADGSIVSCSSSKNADLFHATCGGMGLTGVILEADISLKRINSSFIRETIYKASCLEELLELFVHHQGVNYSVAWIDCLQEGKQMGRSLLMLGEHADDNNLSNRSRIPFGVPFDLPGMLLNPYSISAFNAVYYHRVRSSPSTKLVHYDPFFYPLDSINDWNRLYGKNGFIQYQFVIPENVGKEALTKIFAKIVASKRGSFLAVLKLLGTENSNLLSFPIKGYTLALDFIIDQKTIELLDELDIIISDCGGRIYLTKDSRMSKKTFQSGYPQWEKFCEIREQYGARGKFNSLQSQRLDL